MNRRQFQRRYVFTGRLTLATGLHVGSGWETGSPSDNPIMRTPDGRPFIPGSSFKGAFRSTVEKLTETVGLQSCLLMEGQGCIGAQGKEQQDFNKMRNESKWSAGDLLGKLNAGLCDTCKLFGSPYMVSRILFGDLTPIEKEGSQPAQLIQVRDGVAIDRDSETAIDGFKFDYEVVDSALAFGVRIQLDDPSDHDLALACLGLSEFVSGFGYLGGKRSRGLGNCQLEDLVIYSLDLSKEDRAEQLKKYLLGKTLEKKMHKKDVKKDVDTFLDEKIAQLPALQGGSDA